MSDLFNKKYVARMANFGILYAHVCRAILGISMFMVLCKSEENDCFPSTAATYVTCAAAIPVFDKGNNISTLNYRNCTAGLLSNKTFQELGKLDTLSINCYFSKDARLELGTGIFYSVKSNLKNLKLNHNNIKRLPERTFCELFKVTLIDLSENALDEIKDVGFGSNCREPSEIMKLGNLDIHGNAITTFHNGTFRHLPKLRTLQASHNGLEHIEISAFEGLLSLSSLDLSSNRLTMIPLQVFENLTKLTHLNLTGNALTSSSLANVIYPEGLIVLSLSSNMLTTIDANMFQNLSKLSSLHLSNNQFRVIKSGFASMSSLEKLHLNHAGIEEIKPEAFRGLTALSTLDLNDNKLSKLEPGPFAPDSSNSGKTWSLKTLKLARNSIRDLNVFASFSLQRLEEMDVSENLIEIIKMETFYKAPSLYTLNLSHNKIRVIERGTFDKLTKKGMKGSSLNLDHNELTDIAKLFHSTKLTSISLNHNKLRNFSYSSIPSQLNRLSLSYNQISDMINDISYNLFEELQLEFMNLSHNQISEVANSDFPPWIVELALHNNSINHVYEYLLMSLTKLKTLTLHNNKLDILCFQTKMYPFETSIPKLTTTLSGNPFNCSCELEWLKREYSEINSAFGYIKDLKSVKCRSMIPRYGSQFRNIMQESNDEMLLCKSTHEHSYSCKCASSKHIQCELQCPTRCSCYQNIASDFVLVDCSKSNLTIIPRISFAKVSKLAIFLDGNNINSINDSTFQLSPFITKLYLNNSQIEIIEADSFQGLTSLELLQLDDNMIKMVPDTIFVGLNNLKELYLANNNLVQLHDEIFSPLKSLQILHLNNNSLITFSVWELSKLQLLTDVGLGHNKWSCDCNYIDKFRSWLKEYVNIVHDADNLVCNDQPTGQDFSLISYSFEECYKVTPVQFLARWAPAWGSALGVILLIFLAIIFIFIYRREMQVLIYSRYGVRIFSKSADENDVNKIFDAFIAYSSLDEDFLIADFLPRLEQIENPFKLCLHHRDFLAGGYITDNILEAVEKSRRTIMLLSDNFIKSEWCRYEFKTAHIQMMKDRCNRVIIVVLGKVPKDLDPDMKLYMTTNTFLKWGDTLFWKKLHFALPDKNK